MREAGPRRAVESAARAGYVEQPSGHDGSMKEKREGVPPGGVFVLPPLSISSGQCCHRAATQPLALPWGENVADSAYPGMAEPPPGPRAD